MLEFYSLGATYRFSSRLAARAFQAFRLGVERLLVHIRANSQSPEHYDCKTIEAEYE